MNILIVDDFEISRVFIKNILHELGFENVYDVSNGYSALASLKSKLFDCVITEWEMSDMTGLELLKLIRMNQFIKNTPVLITIDDGRTDSIVSAAKAGASGFLYKPVKKETILENFNKISYKI